LRSADEVCSFARVCRWFAVFYTVVLDDVTCGCDDRKHGQLCKHLIAAALFFNLPYEALHGMLDKLRGLQPMPRLPTVSSLFGAQSGTLSRSVVAAFSRSADGIHSHRKADGPCLAQNTTAQAQGTGCARCTLRSVVSARCRCWIYWLSLQKALEVVNRAIEELERRTAVDHAPLSLPKRRHMVRCIRRCGRRRRAVHRRSSLCFVCG
jgi:hypothetical protein